MADEQNTDELSVLTSVLSSLNSVSKEERERILQTVATFYRVKLWSQSVSTEHTVAPPSESGPYSEDRTISAKEFMLQKQPKTDVEKVACLAYYLTHYRDTQYFKTLDISKINTEAAQMKFSNAANAVENAAKLGYLVPGIKGTKQISGVAEQFVTALPDREAAKQAILSNRSKRRGRKNKRAEKVAPETDSMETNGESI